MAEKFFVVELRSVSITDQGKDARYRDAFVRHSEHGSATDARQNAHTLAFANPGKMFTVIKIIGHAVADIVRDIEP